MDTTSAPIKVCGHCGLTFHGSTWCPECHRDEFVIGERVELTGASADAATAALAWAGQCGYGECAPEVPSPATLAYLKAWGLVA